MIVSGREAVRTIARSYVGVRRDLASPLQSNVDEIAEPDTGINRNQMTSRSNIKRAYNAGKLLLSTFTDPRLPLQVGGCKGGRRVPGVPHPGRRRSIIVVDLLSVKSSEQ